MKRILPLSLFTVFLLFSWLFLSSHSDKIYGVEYSGGPANSGVDKTGGPLSGGNSCGQCHFGGAGSTSMTFELIDSNNVVVTSYIPGGTYTVKHQVTSTSIIKGFQSVALMGANVQAGTFTGVISSQSHISLLNGKQYIEHLGSSGSGLFQFTWVAPPAGSGNVTFYSASNGVNGNGGTTGDTPGSPISNVITEAPWGSFSYGTNDFCENSTDPTPTITGITGGTFSAGTGISVNSTTGTIDISASTPGTYQINYMFTGGTSSQTITINQDYSGTELDEICVGDSVFLQGAWQTTSGTYLSNLQTVAGCDSSVTTILTVLQGTSSQATAEICEGESILIGGTSYSTAGTYSYVIPNAQGCDSTISTVLTVNPTYDDTISETICAGDSTLFAGTWYSATGVYTENGTSVSTCDSITTLNLTVTPLDLTMDFSAAPDLMANQSGATYQWIDCDNGNTPIPGATSQIYLATNWGGNYAVVITYQNCTDTTDCQIAQWFGLDELNFGDVKVFPNPSKGEIGLVFNQAISADLKVSDMKGKLLFEDRIDSKATYVNKLNLEPGTYIVLVSDNEKQSQILWVVQ